MTLFTIKQRRGLSSEWALANTVLRDGQWGVELDTGRAKVGDGITAWNDLEYFAQGVNFVVLELGQTAADVPPETPIGTPIFRKVDV